MDKITKSFRINKENSDKVLETAKKERRNIGDQLDLIIEFYFQQKNGNNDG
jgi:hypothetical protein